MDDKELARICMPAIAFMKKNCTPHDMLIITGAQFKIVTETVSIPINECDKSESGLSDVDGQTSLLTKRSETRERELLTCRCIGRHNRYESGLQ